MRIRLISLGTNWWSTHSRALEDPFRFRRNAAWFNSAGLMYGRRLRLCWGFPGQLRFNSNSGFNPDHPSRALGRTFESTGPTRMNGRMHLLMQRLTGDRAMPDGFVVTLSSEIHGRISFTVPTWKSEDAQPISVSLWQSRYEAMLLLGYKSWVRTDLGVWTMSRNGDRLELTGEQVEAY